MIIIIPERQEEGITFHYDDVEAFIPKNSYEWVDIKLKNEEVIRISNNNIRSTMSITNKY